MFIALSLHSIPKPADCLCRLRAAIWSDWLGRVAVSLDMVKQHWKKPTTWVLVWVLYAVAWAIVQLLRRISWSVTVLAHAVVRVQEVCVGVVFLLLFFLRGFGKVMGHRKWRHCWLIPRFVLCFLLNCSVYSKSFCTTANQSVNVPPCLILNRIFEKSDLDF